MVAAAVLFETAWGDEEDMCEPPRKSHHQLHAENTVVSRHAEEQSNHRESDESTTAESHANHSNTHIVRIAPTKRNELVDVSECASASHARALDQIAKETRDMAIQIRVLNNTVSCMCILLTFVLIFVLFRNNR